MTVFRLCNASNCPYRTPIDPTKPMAAWNTLTGHYKTAHRMNDTTAALYAALHSTTQPAADHTQENRP